jgi:Ca-activated chloride channel family protein
MAALYSFNWRVTREQNFTPNHPPLESALRKLKGEAGTALYDAIYLAAQDLEDRDGRHVMVIVTDGGDTTSVIDSHKALAAAHMSDAVIYPVVVLPITNDAGRNIGGENVLTFMAQGTGGRTFLPTVGAQLDKAFTDIINDLRTQYMIGFYPKDAPLTRDRFHKLEVRLTRPELRVSARNGYYGEAEGAAGSPGARITVDPGSTVKRRQQK